MRNLKNIVKKLIPPIIWDSLKWILKREEKNNNFTFDGSYSSFQDVFRIYPLATGYHSDESSRAAVLAAYETLRNFENGHTSNFGWETFRLNILPTVIYAMLERVNTNKIRICDVGGGLGSQYINLSLSLKSITYDYTIIELPETSNAGNMVFNSYSNIKFTSEFPASFESYDLVYFGSSLQYFDDYEKIIENVCSYSPFEIVITDLPMSGNKSFICAQVNMKDRVIPINVFNLDDLLLVFERFGYKLNVITKSYYPFHDLSNYDLNIERMGFYNLFLGREK
jgi:putative methyltransferase (TIGR04325 family)